MTTTIRISHIVVLPTRSLMPSMMRDRDSKAFTKPPSSDDTPAIADPSPLLSTACDGESRFGNRVIIDREADVAGLARRASFDTRVGGSPGGGCRTGPVGVSGAAGRTGAVLESQVRIPPPSLPESLPMFHRSLTLAQADPDLWVVDRRRESTPGRPHRADRLGELRQPRRAGRAGVAAHQQVRRGLSGQALLRRLRARRRRRVARHRAREEAVRRRGGERAAPLRCTGEPGGVLRRH